MPRASRKDVRDAVRAARTAQPEWAGMTAYNRGQVLYRIAEMIEARTAEFAELCSGRDEVERAIDRIVWYAGWTDKLAQVLGRSNPVAGPYFNFTVPEPTGVVAVVAPEEPPLLGLVSRVAPALVGGNAVVAVASESRPLAAIELAEALATSDVPGGVVNVLTGHRDELAPWLASHMDVNAIDLTGADGDRAELERRAADNVKRSSAASRRAEPVGDRLLPRAEDRLAPGRAVDTSRVRASAVQPGDLRRGRHLADRRCRRPDAARRQARGGSLALTGRTRRPPRGDGLPILWRAVRLPSKRRSPGADAWLVSVPRGDETATGSRVSTPRRRARARLRGRGRNRGTARARARAPRSGDLPVRRRRRSTTPMLSSGASNCCPTFPPASSPWRRSGVEVANR